LRISKVCKIWVPAFLLAIVMAGCSDPDKNAGGPGNPLAPPTVILVTPLNGSVGVCPNNAIISATFSKDMNPATINSPATTFTLTGPGAANVAGTANYVVATRIATFTPSSTLVLNTSYTATITTGVADTFGNHLAANFVWTFATPAEPCRPSGPISLGTACSFGILGATPNVNNTGPTIVTGGDVGVWPAVAITGFPPGTIVGGIKQPGNAVAMTAQGDLATAYNAAGTAAGGTFGLGTGTGTVLPADIGGLAPFPPGVYRTTSAQPSLGITGNVTLDGGGDPNSVWIFQIGSTLITAAGNSHVILIGSAQAQNVFWQVGSSATLGVNTPGSATIFQGTIMANITITLGTGAVLNGRALAQTGTVSMDSNPVNVPACPNLGVAGRQFSDHGNQRSIRRNHYDSGIHHADRRRDAEWQSAGADGRSHIEKQPRQCACMFRTSLKLVHYRAGWKSMISRY
jgi:hypothetical protein